jgi:hypothetical protein
MADSAFCASLILTLNHSDAAPLNVARLPRYAGETLANQTDSGEAVFKTGARNYQEVRIRCVEVGPAVG